MRECIDHGKRGDKDGYHIIKYGDKTQRAHRVAYCEARQIPLEYIKGSVIRHTCDNPRCINPIHLVLGTQFDNVQDRQIRGRQHRPQGVKHPNVSLTPEDVQFIRANYKPHCTEFSGASLAKKFGVKKAAISKIITGRSWQHLTLA